MSTYAHFVASQLRWEKPRNNGPARIDLPGIEMQWLVHHRNQEQRRVPRWCQISCKSLMNNINSRCGWLQPVGVFEHLAKYIIRYFLGRMTCFVSRHGHHSNSLGDGSKSVVLISALRFSLMVGLPTTGQRIWRPISEILGRHHEAPAATVVVNGQITLLTFCLSAQQIFLDRRVTQRLFNKLLPPTSESEWITSCGIIASTNYGWSLRLGRRECSAHGSNQCLNGHIGSL